MQNNTDKNEIIARQKAQDHYIMLRGVSRRAVRNQQLAAIQPTS